MYSEQELHSEQELRQRNPIQVPSDTKYKEARHNDNPQHNFLLGFSGILLLAASALAYIYTDASSVILSTFTTPPQTTHYFSGVPIIAADSEKRDAVVAAFKHAWSAYERDAMGDDEYHPISKKGSNLTEAGGIGYTIVDSIDTMLLMGLSDEYARARDWVANNISFERDANFNTFETTIRVLGGLLSAHHLSEDPIYLEKAVDLADRIIPVFDSPSGLPWPLTNLKRRVGVPYPDAPHLISTAEAATLQLEFRYLSFLTDNEIYWESSEKVMAIIKDARMAEHGLAPVYLTAQEGRFATSDIRLGSRGDSYYEYLLKQYLQTRSTEPVYREMYEYTMTGIHKYLVHRSPSEKTLYTAELHPDRRRRSDEVTWSLIPKQDHLVCFFGGSLMLGATTVGSLTGDKVSIPPNEEQLSPAGQRDWKAGVDLIKTCMDTHETKTGLAPEIVFFRVPGDDELVDPLAPKDREWYIKGAKEDLLNWEENIPYDARYILRPETVESLFIAFRLTGDPKYRKWGWKIFQAIEKHCRVETGGYASVLHVDRLPVRLEDRMETFLMSETYKYLFLLFESANVLPLDEYVFNTEAHPLPIFSPNIRTGFT